MSSPLSAFTAVPNPIMLSFMGAQSFIMMYMAGEAWQYGKRKISAMTNAEFNELTPLELLKQQQSTLKEAIPSMQASMKDMQPLVKTIAAEMLKAIPEIIKGLGQGAQELINPTAGIGPHANIVNVRYAPQIQQEKSRGLEHNPLGIEIASQESIDKLAKFGSNVSKYVTGGYEREAAAAALSAKQLRIQTGQKGREISEKRQRIPLTETQVRLFKRYKIVIVQVNTKKLRIKQGLDQGIQKRRTIIQLASAQNELQKIITRINQAKSVNLKGFELYYKWLATQ